jgi:hypothetical protein
MLFPGLIENVGIDVRRIILQDWSWLIGVDKDVAAISIFGDAFLTDVNRSIFWLDTGSGCMEKVTNNFGEFLDYLNTDKGKNDLLLDWLQAELATRGFELQNDEIFSYKKLPIVGGKYEVDNIIRLNVCEHFSVTASLHFQMKDLPDGTIVRLKAL